MLIYISAFWGQSFVAELTRISEQAEKKTKLRRESTINREKTDDRPATTNGVDGIVDGKDGVSSGPDGVDGVESVMKAINGAEE